MEKNLDTLWNKLSGIESKAELRKRIYEDIQANENRYKALADDDALRFYILLGGDFQIIETINWAPVYTYHEYITDNDLEYDEEAFQSWNIEKESNIRANETAHWYVTGISNLGIEDGLDLPFTIGYTEGYADEVIDTPYRTSVFPGTEWVMME
jgi:hypothetical protein